MSSSVCQGLQSCLEPRLIEPRVLGLKLAQPNSDFPRPSRRPSGSNSDHNNPKEKSHNEENSSSKNNDNNKNKNSFDVSESKNTTNDDMSSWSFIQAITNNSQNSKEIVENDKVYIHPLVKRSSSMLSGKSLEMCTESLGCETGSDISENCSDDIPSPPSESTNFLIKQQSKLLDMYSSKKLNRSRSFPPPLTSISGSAGCVQVRPHREGGRLVIKAVAVSPCNSYFHAERGNGRLRLCLFKDNNSGDFDYTTAEEREEMGMEDVEQVGVEDEEEEEEEEEEKEEIDYGEEEEEDDGDCDFVCCWGEEVDGNSENVGGEIGIEKLPRPSRCKEGGHGNNKGLWNLETYNWVATS